MERDKAALARSLHDDTGGLLVAALMDVTSAQAHLAVSPSKAGQRLERAHATLHVAIELNRRMVEELRPTLLDNFGLYAALRWHFSGACKAAEIDCEEHLPDPEPPFSGRAAITFYRITQTVLALLIGASAKRIVLELALEADVVHLRVTGEGLPSPLVAHDEMTADALASMQGRMRGLGGELRYELSAERASFVCQASKGAALL